MKVIAIGGVPATGKSTLMKALVEDLGGLTEVTQPEKLVYGHAYDKVFIFGRYDGDNAFPGTDRMSMAVQPMAKKYIEDRKDEDLTVIFEGDRLFNQSFLTFIYETIKPEDLFILILKASKDEVSKRHVDRADTQDDKFLSGRVTKYANIASDLVLQERMKEVRHQTPEDTKNIIKIINIIRSKT